MAINHQKILLYDRGDHSYLASRFARDAEKVYHFTPILSRQPKNKDDQIGAGYEGVEKIDDFEKYRKKADLIVFPGEFDGEVCDRMWKEGRRAFGSGLSAELEINRILFLDTLKKVGLPIIKTYRFKGMPDAIEHLKDKKDKWIKAPWTRGDFDTKHFQTFDTFEPWFVYMRNKLGRKGYETIELLVQDAFPCVCEGGDDRYIIDGKRTDTGTIGYEKKDMWYVYRIVKKVPAILDNIYTKIVPEFKNRGYRGAISTEDRINEKGQDRFTDLTSRIGSPPGEGICESYTSFTQDVFDVADGKTPKMEYDFQYGAMIVLISSWNEEQELCVEFPKELEKNVKLRHSYKHKGKYYCVPNESSGYFGAVVAQGKTIKEAIDKVNKMVEQVICLDLEFNKIRLDEAEKLIKDGKQFGLEM
jgi:phosphoribosylamine-glycine ligase